MKVMLGGASIFVASIRMYNAVGICYASCGTIMHQCSVCSGVDEQRYQKQYSNIESSITKYKCCRTRSSARYHVPGTTEYEVSFLCTAGMCIR
jgi:hypothetical protein